MTISAPTFQRLQSGVTSADDKRVMNPVNVGLAWLGGELVTQLNTHFGAVSNSLSQINSSLASISSSLLAISQSVSVQIANRISVFESTRPSFSANKNGSNQLSISNADTTVSFGTEEWDIGSYFAGNTWTPPNGRYRISAAVAWLATNGVADELLQIILYKGASAERRVFYNRTSTGSTPTCLITAAVSVDGSTGVFIAARKGGVGAGDIDGTTTLTWFQGEKI